MRRSHNDEFPLLPALGLYAADIRGDGNCLFNALSDQIYGDQTSHGAIRARVIEHMRDNADYYKQFIDVHPGGGIRRNPKRKNAGTYSTPMNAQPPSTADVDRVFESHITAMAKGGTYGDNMEITAFSSAFEVDVKVYQRDFAYMISGTGGNGGDGGDGGERGRTVAHIAYHTWEHYSSIRNLDGPHDGLPVVKAKQLSPEEEEQQREILAKPAPVLPWQIEAVTQALPSLADMAAITEAIKHTGGNIDAAVSALLEDQEYASASSAQESSSFEPEPNSDDELRPRPNKKQDRRMSRNTKRTADSRRALSNLSVYDGSQESIGSWEDSETSSLPDSTQQTTFTPASFDSTDSRSTHVDQQSTRDPSAPRPTIRLKLNAPKPPDSRTLTQQRLGKTSQKQLGPRVSTRDRKDIRKRAQKAARKAKERVEAAKYANPVDNRNPTEAGLALRQNGMTETPPVETLRTLYI